MPNTAQFLIERLMSNGVKHMFNVPGDYSLTFNKYVEESGIELIGTTSEANAGFAADAYARVNGLSVVCCTYCVGGFNLINSVAGAYSEKSPVIIISGSPGMKERSGSVRQHHMVGDDYDAQFKKFQGITCASTILRDPSRAAFEIDRMIESAKHFKQPVYIELPRDMVEKAISYDAYTVGTPASVNSDTENLNEVLSETVSWIKEAKNPVIWAGVEVARYGLGPKLLKFAEQNGIPIATDILGKSCVSESHPMSLGVYSEGISRPEVLEYFDKSDCIIMLGVMITDMNLGFVPLKVKRKNAINATSRVMEVRNHSYTNVQFGDYVDALCKMRFDRREDFKSPGPAYVNEWKPGKTTTLKAERLMEKVNSILTDKMTVIADVGDSLFGALEITVHGHNQFIASAFYTSMGFAVPGALGVQTANPSIRPIVLVGDGAFQMTGMEFSSLVRRKLNPIVVVLNNGGYGTERILLEGRFNDIQNWNYENMPLLVNGGKGVKVTTEEELEVAFTEALKSNEAFIINAVIEPGDFTPALTRMFSKLAKRV